MATENPSKNPAGVSRPRLKSLMMMVGMVAFGLGLLAWAARTTHVHEVDKARFSAWVMETQQANAGVSMDKMTFAETSSTGLWRTSNTTYALLTPTGKSILIKSNFRTEPFSNTREVTIESAGRSVTRPFADIQAGRKIDLKAEFPEAFR